MGFIMNIIAAVVKGAAQGIERGIAKANLKVKYATHIGGHGRDRFKSVIDAHSDIDEIIEEFDLTGPECKYIHPDYGVNCYTAAEEELEEIYDDLATELGVEVDELISEEQIEALAYNYAEELAEMYYEGDTWTPTEIWDWAWYELSDHNG